HGYVRFEVSGRLSESEPDFTEVDVTFVAGAGDRSGSMSFDRFPYTLSNVTGRLFASVTEQWADIVVRDFSGRGSELPGQTDPSCITINGQVLVSLAETPEGEEAPLPIMDLRIEANRVPVDSAMLTAFTRMLQEPGSQEKPALVAFTEKLN